MTAAKKYNFNELCKELRKPNPLVHSLMTNLDLYIPPKEEGFSSAYMAFMKKIIALRTFSVPVEEIRDIFIKEKKILELLHIDSLSDSPSWYLAACRDDQERTDNHLLLTGHDIGFPIFANFIQSNLDFGDRDPELFESHEMGEDIRHVLQLYLKLMEKVRSRIQNETPTLEYALIWSEQAFWMNQKNTKSGIK